MNSRWKIYYDDSCPVCRNAISFLRKWDKTSVFEYSGVFASDEIRLESPSGDLYTGAQAVDQILEILPLARPIIWALRKTFFFQKSVPAYYLMKSIRRSCFRCETKIS